MSKISKVVLYKHGVGYFERKAQVSGDAEVGIGFRAEEMNDVLKSLTVFDSGGGTVNSVSYDNQKPISKLLEEISLDLPQTGGGASLLGAVRGARVQVTAKTRMVVGQVVGIEERLMRQEGATAQTKILSVFDKSGAMHSFNVENIISVAFLDEHLRKDLQFLFDTLLSATKSDTKNLKLFARGEGERELSISYVVETPIWKTSYRMALPGSEQEKPYLQGWALVDNPQDEDWEDVQLSLVSGLPISFTHDLYSPRYLQRKEIEVERESAAAPVMAEGALFDACDLEAGGGGDLFGGVGGVMPAAAPPPPPPMRRRSAQMASSQRAETVTQKVGQLFEYRIDHPVTVLRNQSALVPIVGDEFEGRRKLLYNEHERPENPFAVVDFKNSTGLTLEGGPLTVYEGDVYAGEAMMDTVEPEEERMLPYAVALAVSTKVERSNREAIVSLNLSQSTWIQKTANYRETTYRFSHKGQEDKELILEHPISEAELVNTPEPNSETRNYWRFSVNLKAGQQTVFKVTEKTTQKSQVRLADCGPERVMYFLSQSGPDAELKEVVKKLRAATDEIHALGALESETQQSLGTISEDQKRLRKNLSSLGQSEDENRLRSRYVSELEAQEDQLTQLRSQLDQQKQQREDKQKAFFETVAELTLEKIFEQ